MIDHSGLRKAAHISLALGFFTLSASAYALSCPGVEDRFFVRCSDGKCEIAFRARDIRAPGACVRRTVVEPVAADVVKVVLDQCLAGALPGAYELTLVHRYYAEPPASASELQRAFAVEGQNAPKVMVKPLSEGTDLAALHSEWSRRASNSHLKLLAHWIVNLALSGAVLYLLYRAFGWLRNRRSPTAQH
ncbi:MAG: hypothetical protein HYY98_00930 [Burkholderiales bacterium]|jgi:hypothetical protein|nr:hypothetical protein [Burkholderiales bacterium]